VQSGEAPPLVLERTIPLEHVGGRIDHMAVDLGRQRLIVAELGNGTVDVIDLAAGKAMHRIGGLRSPQGVGYAPGSDMIVVASADDGTVRMFRAGDFGDAGTVALKDDADNVRIDPRSGTPWSATAAAVSPSSIPRLARSGASRAAGPSGGVPARLGGRASLRQPAGRASHRGRRHGRRKVAATWQVPGRATNFPLAVAGDGTAVAIVFRSPARLVLLDPQSGAVTADVETCGDADDVFSMRSGS